MLGSGHIRYYMETHRNLYKLSQQGWESLNSKFKQVFFRHTQRGGNYGKVTEENELSYLFSIMKAFQRELLWISGDAEKYFNTNK
jgi:DNA-binding PadR family transcriptional regulator